MGDINATFWWSVKLALPSVVAKSKPDEKKQIRQTSRGRWNSDLKVSLVVRPSLRTARATKENLG